MYKWTGWGDFSLELINVLTYLSGICIIFVLCRIFIVPLKAMLKLILNSIFGAIIILLINFIGGFFNLHIGLNFFTILFVSILGIPGAILLTIIRLFIWFSYLIFKGLAIFYALWYIIYYYFIKMEVLYVWNCRI